MSLVIHGEVEVTLKLLIVQYKMLLQMDVMVRGVLLYLHQGITMVLLFIQLIVILIY